MKKTRILELYGKYKEIILYIFFGGLTTIVSIVSFAWCDVVLHMNPLIANVISWILSVTFAYVTNKIWVFQAKTEGVGEMLKQCIGFYGGRLLTLVMEEMLLLIFINIFHFPSLLVKIGAQFIVLAANYIISKWIVFKERKS